MDLIYGNGGLVIPNAVEVGDIKGRIEVPSPPFMGGIIVFKKNKELFEL